MSNEISAPPSPSPALPEPVRAALAHGHVIDITTTGRRSGQPRRIEIVFHNVDGRLYISGMPRRATRAWLHNLRADPGLTLHLKGGVVADLPANAREVTDADERQTVFEWIVAHAWRGQDVGSMIRYSPLVEVRLGAPAA